MTLPALLVITPSSQNSLPLLNILKETLSQGLKYFVGLLVVWGTFCLRPGNSLSKTDFIFLANISSTNYIPDTVFGFDVILWTFLRGLLKAWSWMVWGGSDMFNHKGFFKSILLNRVILPLTIVSTRPKRANSSWRKLIVAVKLGYLHLNTLGYLV